MKLRKVTVMLATSLVLASTALSPVMTSFAQGMSIEAETMTPEEVLAQAKADYEKALED